MHTTTPTVGRRNPHQPQLPQQRPDDDQSSQQSRSATSMEPLILERPGKPRPTTLSSLRAILYSSFLNVLLLFIPVGWALYFAHVNAVVVFICTFLAIIPLAKLLGFATEELELRVGPTLGGLLNATLGNAVELIVAVIALFQCKMTVVQSSLTGSILSNLLLVLGMCFFFGGLKWSDQSFKQAQSQMNSTLLVLSVIAVLVPGAFYNVLQLKNNADNTTSDNISNDVLKSDIVLMSHGVAVILLVIYGCYLFFTIYTHADAMKREEGQDDKSTPYPVGFHIIPSFGSHKSNDLEGQGATRPHLRLWPFHRRGRTSENDTDEPEVPQLTIPVTVGLLAVVTVLVGVTSEFLVDSIDGVTATGYISEEWLALILLPIVGNAAEHVTAVTVAVKDKVDLAINVAVGSSIQIAVFLIPFVVVVAWMAGKPLTLLFDPFESVTLFLAVLTVSYCVQDGRSNWLEGMVLMNLYVILAVCFWFYPGYNPTTELGLTCTGASYVS